MRIFVCLVCNKTQEHSKGGRLPKYCVGCRPREVKNLCAFSGCDKRHYARGFCNPHYQQIITGRTLAPLMLRLPLDSPDRPICSGPDCDKVASCNDLCALHNQQYWKGIPLVPTNYQDNCNICGEFRLLKADHDHACCPSIRTKNTKKRCGTCHRGFICSQCNTALGMVKDNTVILNRMINYINENNQEVYV